MINLFTKKKKKIYYVAIAILLLLSIIFYIFSKNDIYENMISSYINTINIYFKQNHINSNITYNSIKCNSNKNNSIDCNINKIIFNDNTNIIKIDNIKFKNTENISNSIELTDNIVNGRLNNNIVISGIELPKSYSNKYYYINQTLIKFIKNLKIEYQVDMNIINNIMTLNLKKLMILDNKNNSIQLETKIRNINILDQNKSKNNMIADYINIKFNTDNFIKLYYSYYEYQSALKTPFVANFEFYNKRLDYQMSYIEFANNYEKCGKKDIFNQYAQSSENTMKEFYIKIDEIINNKISSIFISIENKNNNKIKEISEHLIKYIKKENIEFFKLYIDQNIKIKIK